MTSRPQAFVSRPWSPGPRPAEYPLRGLKRVYFSVMPTAEPRHVKRPAVVSVMSVNVRRRTADGTRPLDELPTSQGLTNHPFCPGLFGVFLLIPRPLLAELLLVAAPVPVTVLLARVTVFTPGIDEGDGGTSAFLAPRRCRRDGQIPSPVSNLTLPRTVPPAADLDAILAGKERCSANLTRPNYQRAFPSRHRRPSFSSLQGRR